MVTRGASHIKSIRSLNTRPGPVTESNALLRMYLMAVEKDNLMKKLEWVEQQKNQTEKRLAEIAHAMHEVKTSWRIRPVESRLHSVGLATCPLSTRLFQFSQSRGGRGCFLD